jgi:hypothetical protein
MADNSVEEQPVPAASPEFQAAVGELGRQLMRKFQLNGNQFNALELELRVFILVEQVNMLTKIVQQATGGTTDEAIHRQMTLQVDGLAKSLAAQLDAAPRIAIAAGAPKLNNKHN